MEFRVSAGSLFYTRVPLRVVTPRFHGDSPIKARQSRTPRKLHPRDLQGPGAASPRPAPLPAAGVVFSGASSSVTTRSPGAPEPRIPVSPAAQITFTAEL